MSTELEGYAVGGIVGIAVSAGLIVGVITELPTSVDAPPPMIPATWAPVQPPHPELECWQFGHAVACRSTTEECP